MITVVNEIEAIGGPVTRAELDNYDTQIAEIMGQPVAEEIRRPIVRLTSGTYQAGAFDAARATGVRISFGLPDSKALQVLDDNIFFWIGNYYPEFAQDKIQARLREYFQGGLNRRDLLLRFRADFLGEMKRAESYWDLLADQTATQVREIGRVAGYEKANVTTIRVKARLDDRTTTICRKLHGQVIDVQVARKQVNRYLKQVQSRSKEGVKRVWPWVTEPQAKKINTQAKVDRMVETGKIGLPPYHARCRTRTVAEFTSDPGERPLTDKDKERGAIPLKGKKKKPGPAPKKKPPPTAATWLTRSLRSVKTQTDAEDYLDARYKKTTFDFKGITEVETLREMAREWDEFGKIYPEVADSIKYYGTQWGKKFGDVIRRTFPANPQAVLRKARFEKNVYAHMNTENNYLGMNPKFFGDRKSMKRSLKRDVETGFHPLGTTEPGSVITHELDHAIFNYYDHIVPTGASFLPVVGSSGLGSYRDTTRAFLRVHDRPENLSLYARENQKEGWAEGSAAGKHGSRSAKLNPYVQKQKKLLRWYRSPTKKYNLDDGSAKWFQDATEAEKQAQQAAREQFNRDTGLNL